MKKDPLDADLSDVVHLLNQINKKLHYLCETFKGKYHSIRGCEKCNWEMNGCDNCK